MIFRIFPWPHDTCTCLLNKHKTLSLAWLSFALLTAETEFWKLEEGQRRRGRVGWGGGRVEGKEGTEVQERRAAMGKMETNTS